MINVQAQAPSLQTPRPYLSHIIFLLVQAQLTLKLEICSLLKSNTVTFLVPWRRTVPDGNRLQRRRGTDAHCLIGGCALQSGGMEVWGRQGRGSVLGSTETPYCLLLLSTAKTASPCPYWLSYWTHNYSQHSFFPPQGFWVRRLPHSWFLGAFPRK